MWEKIIIIRKVMKDIKEDHVSAYSAQAAYFIMLSCIPFVMLLFSLIQYTPVTRSDVYTLATNILPAAIDPMVISIIDEVYEKSVAIVSVTAVTAAWTSAKGMLSIMRGLNTVFDVKETRNYILLRLESALYTVIFIISIILSLVLLVFGNRIHLFIIKYAPILENVSRFLIEVRTVGIFGILIVFFLIIYRFVPNRKTTLKSQIPGAVFAAFSWSLFSFGFSVYIDRYSDYSKMYGSLTTAILAMLWLYFCMYLMLIGAEINSKRLWEKI